MMLGEFDEQLIGIEANFARDGLDDRAAINSFGQFPHAAALEQLDHAHRQLRRLGELPERHALFFAGGA